MQHRDPPGWALPILLGAAFTLLLQGALSASLTIEPVFSVLLCCCGPIAAVPYGFLPAFIAQRRDRSLSPGQGFAVACIATGIGTVAWAIIIAMQTDSAAIEALESSMRELFDQAARDAPAGRQLSPEDREQAIAALVSLFPYLPVIQAVVLSLLAGVVGLVTVLIFRPRHRDPHPPLHQGDPTGMQ